MKSTVHRNRPGHATGKSLLVIQGEVFQSHPLPDKGVVSIGRDPSCTIVLDDDSISRTHARIHLGQVMAIEDLGSSNGTFVRQTRLETKVLANLHLNEAAEVGSVTVLVQSIGVLRSEHLAASTSAKTGIADNSIGAPIVESSAMKHLWALASRVAVGDINVLIVGETGVGKEVLAEHIHNSSKRSKGRFLRINCGALMPSLLESELFGHEKGAFTGADKAKPGLVETASGGTLFLDELGEAPKDVQVRLLRVLEESKVMRVGGRKPIDIDLRVVAATNCDLPAQIESGGFRMDLYYRIAGVTLPIPPLRERSDDILPLANSILRAAAAKMQEKAPSLSSEAETVLLSYAWPGNIRELRNALESAILLRTDDTIGVDDLPSHCNSEARPEPMSLTPTPASGKDDERERIVRALQEHAGNQTLAAKAVGVSRRTLAKRLIQYNIPRPRKG